MWRPRALTQVDPFPMQWRAGVRFERIVARQLHQYGIEARSMPKKCRPRIGDAPYFSDHGDVEILGTRWILEVKSRRLAFGACPADFPFPRVLVDSARAVQHLGDRACAIAVISQKTRAVVVIPLSSRAAWTRGTIDTLDGPKDAFFVPRACLRRFSELALWLACQRR